MSTSPLDELRFATWKELVRTRFRVEAEPAKPVELELLEVEFTGESAKDKAGGPRYESFSLIFSGAAAERLTQKTYRLKHQKLGDFDLFIVPIAVEEGTMRYQAVFNRLLPLK